MTVVIRHSAAQNGVTQIQKSSQIMTKVSPKCCIQKFDSVKKKNKKKTSYFKNYILMIK